jgi:hypothetical protein
MVTDSSGLKSLRTQPAAYTENTVNVSSWSQACPETNAMIDSDACDIIISYTKFYEMHRNTFDTPQNSIRKRLSLPTRSMNCALGRDSHRSNRRYATLDRFCQQKQRALTREGIASGMHRHQRQAIRVERNCSRSPIDMDVRVVCSDVLHHALQRIILDSSKTDAEQVLSWCNLQNIWWVVMTLSQKNFWLLWSECTDDTISRLTHRLLPAAGC